MKVLRTVAEARAFRKSVGDVAFVPTMGAFHEGHYELMRTAKRLHPTTVVSLFVNPTQFNDPRDLERYPRREQEDLDGAESQGVDAVFAPAADEMYANPLASVRVCGVSDRWEGEHRPGHFDGVATVVLKLFNILSPNTAVFGLKDLQQCAVVSAMVESLNVPVTVVKIETVRDADGLALSSRNALLTPEERAHAPQFYRTLSKAAQILKVEPQGVLGTLATAKETLEATGFVVQYLALVDPRTMSEIPLPQPDSRIVAAVTCGRVRLIDNVCV